MKVVPDRGGGDFVDEENGRSGGLEELFSV